MGNQIQFPGFLCVNLKSIIHSPLDLFARAMSVQLGVVCVTLTEIFKLYHQNALECVDVVYSSLLSSLFCLPPSTSICLPYSLSSSYIPPLSPIPFIHPSLLSLSPSLLFSPLHRHRQSGRSHGTARATTWPASCPTTPTTCRCSSTR